MKGELSAESHLPCMQRSSFPEEATIVIQMLACPAVCVRPLLPGLSILLTAFAIFSMQTSNMQYSQWRGSGILKRLAPHKGL